MRNFMMAAALAALSTLAFAQGKAPAKTQTAPVPDELTSADDIRWGHNIVALLDAGYRAPRKDDFETQQAYETRIKKWLERPVYGTTLIWDRIAATGAAGSPDLKFSDIHWEYDADTRMLRACLSKSSLPLTSGTAKWGFRHAVKTVTVPLGTYVGSNAYGVKRTVRKERVTEYALDVVVPRDEDPCTQGIEVEPEAARRAVKNGVRYALIGRLVPPFTEVREAQLTPSIHSPIDRAITEVTGLFVLEEVALFTAKTNELLVVTTIKRDD